MSKKLQKNIFDDSLDALRRFRNDNSSKDLHKYIIIMTNDSQIKSYENVEVIVADRHPHYKIDIYWEEVIDDFRDLGLKGTYDPEYAFMSYDGTELIINSDGNKIIIK